METKRIRIRGLAGILMHNGQLTDPMNEWSRALSDAVKVAKKSKTAAAWESAAKAEFMGGLYLNEKLEPCIPGELIEAVICEGAKKSKQGKEVKAGLIVDGNFPLEYKGPRDPEKLWKAKYYKTSPAKVGQARVMRTRPMFMPGWECEFVVTYNKQLVDERDLLKFIEKAGAEVGLCDWRPKYGRFEVVK